MIPDNPPHGVLMRHEEAREQFGKRATFYFLRPTFNTEHGRMDVYTGEMARDDADWDKSDIVFMAKLYGTFFRQAALAKRLAVGSVNLTLQCVAATARGVARAAVAVEEIIERDRLRREARSIPSGIHPERLQVLLARSVQLGLLKEAECFQRALGGWEGYRVPRRLNELSIRVGTFAVHSRSESAFIRTVRQLGSTDSLPELRLVYREVQELRRWDPVLCFELKDQPGTLYLVSHWFVGHDCKTYVHY